MNHSKNYREEVDGLRAIAVIPVVLFHAGFPGFAGGYIGVDVFFVISGYLISGILLREVASGTYSIAAFYERRARRILPALVLVLLISCCFALAWMLPWQLEEFGSSLLSTLLFGSNFYFVGSSDYFAPTSEEMPLLHTWSLAVEEQFYLVFPLLFAFLLRRGVRAASATILVLALTSLALTEIGWRRWPDENFFLLPTRAWELLVGSLVAIWQHRRRAPTGTLGGIFAAMGLSAILISVVMFDRATPFPSFWALLPVGGAALVLAFGMRNTTAGRFLSWRPFVQIGLISYSLYLWHQPLFAFARIRHIGAVPMWLMLVLSVVAVVLAWTTWKFVETPSRNKAKIGTTRFVSWAGALNFLALAVGTSIVLGAGFPSRLPAEVNAMAELGRPSQPEHRQCASLSIPGAELCEFQAANGPQVVIWGDSHAMALAPSLAKALRPVGAGLIDATKGGCMPVPNVYAAGRERCLKWNERVLDWLESQHSPRIVVISSRWAPALHGTTFDNGEGGREPEEAIDYRHVKAGISLPLTSMDMQAELIGVGARLKMAGKEVVLVAGVPEMGWNVPETLAKSIMYGEGPIRPLSISLTTFDQRNAPVMSLLATVEAATGSKVIDPSEIFCRNYAEDRCVAEHGDAVFYRDDDHLSRAGADALARKVVEEAWPVQMQPHL